MTKLPRKRQWNKFSNVGKNDCLSNIYDTHTWRYVCVCMCLLYLLLSAIHRSKIRWSRNAISHQCIAWLKCYHVMMITIIIIILIIHWYTKCIVLYIAYITVWKPVDTYSNVYNNIIYIYVCIPHGIWRKLCSDLPNNDFL